MNANPFSLRDDRAYRRWRERKLDGYPRAGTDLLVRLGQAGTVTPAEHAAILSRCRKANVAIYEIAAGDYASKACVRSLGRCFGLERLDGNLCADGDRITSLRVIPEGRRAGYIPYSDRRLNWHTDGYYNPGEFQIRAFVMHCVRDAVRGGDNGLLDPEMVYLQMRDAKPRYVEALMQADAVTIPANSEGGAELRGARTGPVFSIDPDTGALHMRYTARTRSIRWKDDHDTRAAAAMLAELVGDDSPFVFRHRLGPGQGVVCNNVLHSRSAFEDDPDAGRSRLLYRARYYDRIAGTGPAECEREVAACSG